MTYIARKRRWSRFVDPQSGSALIVPIDHGLTIGPVRGIARLEDLVGWVSRGLQTGVVVHKGLAERLGLVTSGGMMIHLNGALSLDEQPDRKRLLTSVEASMRLGADAVSVQTNFLPANTGSNLRLLGRVIDDAHQFGLPVLAMLYDKTGTGNASERMRRMRHFVRAAVEMGVDAIKLGVPDDLSAIAELIDGVQSHTSVVFAGGERKSDAQLVELARAIVQYGGAGLCVGRNVFQHDDPCSILAELRDALRTTRTACGEPDGARRFPGELRPHFEPHGLCKPVKEPACAITT
ncbi:class I fructose-bisphosphate aldolase [Paraburkholderia sp. GAS348]|uniref:class I fructose-bisphosphate aldolase n=1 Tax=Paraburkholderia sp. GAS348 TaxID=3035132 RepID=UPI003D22C318